MNNTSFIKQLIGILSLCFLLMGEALAASPEAGQVLMVAGAVSAKGVDGQARALSRRSPVNVGDTLTTGKESQTQIRMKDGAMIALGADAEFVIKAYSSKKAGDAKDGAVLSLVKGGLRTITGEMEKSAYKMQTPVATLGIRGTVFDVYVKPDGTTTVVLREGGVDVTGDGKLQPLNVAGLATLVKPGEAPTDPGPPSQEVLDYLRGIFGFVPDDVTWYQDEDGNTVFDIGGDIVNVVNNQPPAINGDGDPNTETTCSSCSCNPSFC